MQFGRYVPGRCRPNPPTGSLPGVDDDPGADVGDERWDFDEENRCQMEQVEHTPPEFDPSTDAEIDRLVEEDIRRAKSESDAALAKQVNQLHKLLLEAAKSTTLNPTDLTPLVEFLKKHPTILANFLMGKLPAHPYSRSIHRPTVSSDRALEHRIFFGEVVGSILRNSADRLIVDAGAPHVLGEAFLDYLRAAYRTTRSPLFVWRAYRAARRIGAPVPDWVQTKLDTWAERLVSLHFLPSNLRENPSAKIHRPPLSLVDEIAVALEFRTGTRGTPTTISRVTELIDAALIYLALQKHGATDELGEKAITRARKDRDIPSNISDRSVRERWRRAHEMLAAAEF